MTARTHPDPSATPPAPHGVVPGPGVGTAVLAIGFGTSVAMWAIGYVARIPPVWMPSALLLVLLLACHLAGGLVAGRDTSRGVPVGAAAGVLTALINLLVLGSLLGGEHPGQVVPAAAIWVPGSILAGAVLGGLGALLGMRVARARAGAPAIDWTHRFARVAVGVTLLLLVAGGVVTSTEAGLAVVDWPNSFGYNMFLFPLSRMTGGVYYEHAHRLLGALVGLTILVLTIQLLRSERRRFVKGLALATLGGVIVQGILGGLRVTGRFTTTTSPAETEPSLLLAAVHGVLGQLVLASLVAVAVFTSTTWKSPTESTPLPHVRADRRLTVAFFLLLVVQLVLGAMLRHFAGGLHLHLTMAVVVIIVGMVLGTRAAGLYHAVPLYRRIGRGTIHLLGMQLVLGLTALLTTSLAANVDPPPAYEVITTLLHQATGAILLAWSVLLLLWLRRLVRDA